MSDIFVCLVGAALAGFTVGGACGAESSVIVCERENAGSGI